MKEIGIYVHIPFCKSKCFYCDFVSFANKEEQFLKYKNALIDEIRNSQEIKNHRIKTVFIGGGTPTVFPGEYITEILEEISKYTFTQNPEITIEANPNTLNEDFLRKIKTAGVNRLSIGLQSTNNDLLKKMGRIHKYEDFIRNYNDATKIGFKNISCDLILGVPDETLEDFQKDLKEVVNLGLNHISAYSLIVEEGTPFYKLYDEGNLNLAPEEDEIKMYEYLISFLKENGYINYEISNFAKEGYHSKHNTIYWERGNYLGFGISAHSLIDNVRFENTTDLDDYIENSKIQSRIRQNTHKLSIDEQKEEFMFLGLRLLKGISTEKFKSEFNEDIFSVYQKEIMRNIDKGLLIYENNRIFLSAQGIRLSNIVMSEFLF